MIAFCLETWPCRVLARRLFTMVLATTVLATTAFWAAPVSAEQPEEQDGSETQQPEATDDVTGEAEATDDVKGETKDDGKFLVVPVPIIDPTIGNGLALTGLYTFPAGDASEGTPRSTLGVVAGYTNTDSWMAGGVFKLYLDEDRYRVGLNVGYGNFNLKYYGTSSDSPFFDNPVGFLIKGPITTGSAQIRVAGHLYAGLTALYTKPAVSLDSPIDLLPDLDVNFELAALGVTGEYDSRDNIWFPDSGSLGNIELLQYVELGEDGKFPILDADYSKYWGLSEQIVLAGNVGGAQAGDDTPFFLLPSVSIRGFPAGQYMGQSIIQGQAELRWMFWKKFGAVAFAGAGIAATSFSDLEDGSRAYGVGGGIRYRISDVDKMNIGLDVAYGSSDDVAVYFRVGEAF